jgi:hypothetical protein
MATNRDLLKEAIADAKAVKETAIANAKAALQEAFTPQVQALFAAKLQEIEKDDVEEMYGKSEDEKMKMEEADDMKMDEADEVYESEDDINELDLEELLRELEEEETAEGLYEAEEEEEESEEEEEESEEGEDEGEPLDLEDMTDEDLKSMIEDVIKDMINSGELEAGHEGEGEEESEESEEEEVDLAELLREIEEMEEKETVDELLGFFKTNSILSYLTDVKKMSKDAAKQALKDLEEKNISPISADEVEDLRQYLLKDFDPNRVGSMINKVEAAIKGGKAVERPLGGAEASQAATIGEMKAELAEAFKTINALKSELNEINLLNAKLLYTNKIFKAKNLNENQKVKVLSSFDKATTVGEVKMVFETLNEGIKVSKNTIKENLGSASKAMVTPNAKKPIVESNDAFLRMQKLAGII